MNSRSVWLTTDTLTQRQMHAEADEHAARHPVDQRQHPGSGKLPTHGVAEDREYEAMSAKLQEELASIPLLQRPVLF